MTGTGITYRGKELRELVLSDILLLGFTYFILNLCHNREYLPRFVLFLQELFLISVLAETIFYTQDLSNNEATAGIREFFLDLGIMLLIGGVGILSLYFYPPYHILVYYFLTDNRLTYIALLLVMVTLTTRLPLVQALDAIYAPYRVLFLGDGELAAVTANEVTKSRWPRYQIVGFVEAQIEEGTEYVRLKDENEKEHLSHLVHRFHIDKIVVASNQRRGCFPSKELLTCKMQGIEILEAQDIYEELTGKIQVCHLRPSWLIFTPGFRKSISVTAVKRFVDVVMALLGLMLAAPLMLIVALAIKLDSHGTVFFQQERVGQGGRAFILLKFRTMCQNAEKESGPVWAQENDQRITRIGRIIRKLRIDELPQMINVLKGEMSFVGPRPERRFFVEKLQELIPYYSQRLTVKPGITGWAAVKYQYGASVNDALEKLQYDLYYIKNMSLFLDIYITFKTINVILTGKGSR